MRSPRSSPSVASLVTAACRHSDGPTPPDRPGRDEPLNQNRCCGTGFATRSPPATLSWPIRAPRSTAWPLTGCRKASPSSANHSGAQSDTRCPRRSAPGRPIAIAGRCLLIGDGAAQLTVQELGTFSREGLAPVIVVVNNDGYTVERAIHGKTAPYNDIVRWSWTDIPSALGVTEHLFFRAENYGELDDAFTAAAEHQDRMVLIEAVVPRLRHP